MSFLFNRDEQRSRLRADNPSEKMMGDVHVLAPRDPVGKGTWILVNEFGLIVSLLNNYEETREQEKREMRTRGDIPLMFVNCKTAKDVWEKLTRSNFDHYLPFNICCVDLSGDDLVVSWNGEVLRKKECLGKILTTSSYRSQEIQSYREELFRQQAPVDSEEMFRFHSDQSHADLAFNPAMLRDDALTQSMSVIEISKSEISFTYYTREDDRLEFREESRERLKIKK